MRLALLFLSIALPGVAAMPEATSSTTAPRAPGAMVDIGGRRLHAIVKGNGAPAVVFLSGMGDFAVDWAIVQSRVSELTRTVAYDRAGQAWSDAAPGGESQSLIAQADDLEALLVHAHVDPPYLLVGHSWGGAIARVFAMRHLTNVAGMVLVDSTHEDSLLWINGKVLRPRLTPADQWSKLWAPPPPGVELKVQRRTITTLDAPFSKLPADAQTLRLWAMNQQSFEPVDFRKELQSLHDCCGTSKRRLGDRPLVVLTRSLPDTDAADGWTVDRQEQDHLRLQSELTRLSRNSRHVVVEGSGHHIQLDQPAAVVNAVSEVVVAARRVAPRGHSVAAAPSK